MYNGIKAIILDFDGTVFRVFANYNLKATAVKIHDRLLDYGVDFPPEKDAFDAFGFAYAAIADPRLRERALQEVDRIIIGAEAEALPSGILTDGFFDFMDKCRAAGIKVAIASNNSEECIKNFLADNKINYPVPVAGRLGTRPDLMKPHPYLLEKASRGLSLNKDQVIYVGDNPRDSECAKNFGCGFIALTPTENKKNRMKKAMPDVLTAEDFYGLIAALGL